MRATRDAAEALEDPKLARQWFGRARAEGLSGIMLHPLLCSGYPIAA